MVRWFLGVRPDRSTVPLAVLALGPALGLARFGEFGRFTGSAAELTEIKYEIVSARRSVFIVRLKAISILDGG